jgi:hypothetical protein
MLAGYGYLAGALTSALLVYALGVLGSPLLVWPVMIGLSALLLGALLALQRQHRAQLSRHPGQRPEAGDSGVPLWQWLLFATAVLWLLVRLVDLGLEIAWQPLFPWDAWTTWGLRARVWTEQQALIPFVAPERWLAEPALQAQTIDAWDYPSTVSLLSAWPALAYGQWHESLANLPWLGCALALLLGFYGQARRWGASPLAAIAFAWLLLTLPMLDTHIALAGYADLWLATLLGLAFMAFLHWARDRDWRQGAMAGALVLCLPLIKQEGAVWAGLFIPALLALWLRWRGWLLLVLSGSAVLVALHLRAGWTPADLPLPYLSSAHFGLQGDWQPLLRHLFLRSNWHLFGFLLAAALGVAVTLQLTGQRSAWSRVALVWVLGALAALYLLFFWTDAAQWALSGTSINRIVLQFAPALTFWMMATWLQLYSVTDRPRAPGPAPSPPPRASASS